MEDLRVRSTSGDGISRHLEALFPPTSVSQHSISGGSSARKPFERFVPGLLRGWHDRRVDFGPRTGPYGPRAMRVNCETPWRCRTKWLERLPMKFAST